MMKYSDGEIKRDSKKYVIIGLSVMILGLGLFGVWAFTAPLSQGVVAPGSLAFVDKRKTVQHVYGGTVKEIFIKEGSRVKAGQVLMKLDDSSGFARLTGVRSEYFTNLALESRLMAERLGRASVQYPKMLTDNMGDPEVADIIRTQNDLFRKRRDSLVNEKRILMNQKQGVTEYISRMEQLAQSRNKQVALLEKEIESVRSIADEGYYPRNKMIELQQNLQGIEATRSEELATIERTRRSVGELDLKVLQVDSEFSKDVEATLTEVQKRIAGLKEEYNAAQITYNSMIIKAPDDGIVLGLAVHNAGSVVTPGQKILDIAPMHEALIVQAEVMPHDIDSVRLGLRSEVRISALDMHKTPSLFGEVIMVSPDVFVDQSSGRSYYMAQIRIPENELKAKLGSTQRLQAGMPAEVIIETGKRTFMEYLMKPFFNRFAMSMKEQ
ncbi:HlyD family type I secretion periplasmic adaptor subunit [Seleniivibrio woodruffii]|uniref:HlyD family secretion protein/protease secretion system membrane fusion protein/epimerase transport system membrane fusion protein n=1 Tax=Seleniivibrio woodruffii TaxID=1078050 RepID=A0A4R1KCM1_9BACT|nr:HlyD family type I secretion periplasmic adaptor subunit [Seleniivibrio woodruffii]TCK62244.1 HlyD family secretion protein/protease secretion system membrane fusion protein/epimerase transport system membrane fusion protein [Seleniivibrio woodruffii]TVZ34638.1 HlyD family secretion protein/protease secretion system membrane fusion protein/epimerase transport system membrane fusion protein [Seleniivibrio woodruffii]